MNAAVHHRCSVCIHPRRWEAETAIKDGGSVRGVARRFKLSPSAMHRHLKRHRAQDALALGGGFLIPLGPRALSPAARTWQYLEAMSIPVLKLIEAIDRWLTDPDEPGEYTFAPRATEMDVVYYAIIEIPDGVPKLERRKATLQELLDRLAGVIIPVRIRVRTPDARDILLKSLEALRRTVATMAHLTQQEESTPQPKLEDSREWIDLRDLILEALRPYPEALEAVARALKDADSLAQVTADIRN